MMVLRPAAAVALSFLLVLAGCGDSRPAPGTDASATSGESAASATKTAVVPKREGIPGRWKVIIAEQQYEMALAIVEVQAEGDKYSAKLISVPEGFGNFVLETGEGTGEQVHLVFKSGPQVLDFKGRFDDGDVLGTLLVPGKAVLSARLEATQADSFTEQEMRQLPGQDALAKALEAEDSTAALKEFVAKHPTSPLVLDAYPLLAANAKENEWGEKEIEALVDEYRTATRRWGDRFGPSVEIKIASSLASQEYLPEVAERLLKTAEAELTEESPDDWRARIGDTYATLGQPAVALKWLEPLGEKYEFNPMINFALARAYEQNGDKGRALDLYAELAVMPRTEMMIQHSLQPPASDLPSAKAAALWEEKAGNSDGFEDFLEETFNKALMELVPPRETPAKQAAKPRRVLVELFTGAGCPPCVAADLAVSALLKNYSPEELVVLKYHQHIPLPDPLVSYDGDQRFSQYYSPPGTPFTYVNGSVVEGVAGDVEGSIDAYQQLIHEIDPLLEKGTDVELKLSAHAEDGKLHLSAEVQGMATIPPKARLRLALVEDGIRFNAPNGIRYHENIVRAMPGSWKGVVPSNGKLSYSETISLEVLRGDILKELAGVEKQIRQEFPVKPLELKTLKLAAFVQNDETQEVLQAAIVPVTGEIRFPGDEKPAAAASGKEKPTEASETPDNPDK